MASEIEKKYRLAPAQKDAVEKRLAALGAQFEGEDFEENILFAGGDLREREAVLRLRRVGARTILTFKQRVSLEDGVRHNLEHETEIADFDACREIFAGLGYRPALVYEKRRRIFRLGAAEIVLDELPFGEYMEIEAAAETIAAAEELLEAAAFEVVAETYPQLTVKYGSRRGERDEARFADSDTHHL